MDPALISRSIGGGPYGVWQGGRWIAGAGAEIRQDCYSITKAITALAVVRAVGEAWLDLDTPLVSILPEWRADPAKRRITVRMLVNQSAGFSSGVAALYRGRIQDKGRIAIALPLVDPPGTRFRYGPVSAEILGEVMRRKLRERGLTTNDFLQDHLKRMGISIPQWRRDLTGNFYLSTGAQLDVTELGKLGRTISSLASGKNHAGLKADVFRDLASQRPANPMVAAGIWWNRNATRSDATSIDPERNIDAVRPPLFWQRACLGSGVDSGWLTLVGSGGKRVYVLPSRDLVIVRMGRASNWSDSRFLQAISV
jgi:CubicO group peptidase (beta-lactamase class C family)